MYTMQRILLRGATGRQMQLRAPRAVGGSQHLTRTCHSCTYLLSSRTTPLSIDRIRVRYFSSLNDDEIERLTVRILDTTPLGTMSSTLLDDAIAAVQHWCNTETGFGVDSADRLLKRLLYEHSTGSAASRQYTDSIAHLQLQILNSWLRMSSFGLAMEKADAILTSMIQWYERGLSTHDPYPQLVSFIEACLHQGHAAMAVTRLLLWTEVPNKDTETELVSLMNSVLQLCVQQNDAITAAILSERMEVLEAEHEWQNLHITDDARKLILEGALAAREKGVKSSDETAAKQLSSIELEAIQERFMKFLKVASLDDRQKVSEMARHTSMFPQSESILPLYKSFFDYFVRIKDVKHATLTLSRMDEFDYVMTEKNFLDILRLLVKSTPDRDAPWRAQEVVTRMEELERNGRLSISTLTYNLLCQAWAHSAEPAASQKVEDILSRMLIAKENGDASKTPNIDTYMIYLSVWPKDHENRVIQVVSELMNQGTDVRIKEMSHIVEGSLEALAVASPNASSKQLGDRGDVAWKLFHQAVSQGITVTPRMCANFLRTQNRNAVLRELKFLETLTDVTIPIECYEYAIMALLDAREPSFNQKKQMVSKMLKMYSEGSISAESSDVEAILVRIMLELEYHGRPSPVDAMLKLFEELILSDEAPVKDVKVPIDCFNIALKCWAGESDADKVEDTFKRLISYHEAGHDSLQPTTASFSMLLRVLPLTNAPVDKVAERSANIMEQLIELYESTGNDACKPDAFCFATVLTALSKVSSPNAAAKATKFLNSMLELGIQPTASVFNKVMHTILRDTTNSFDGVGKFKRVLSLMRKMKNVGCTPDVLSYKFMLRACRVPHRRDRSLALNVAMDAMGQLRKSGKADAASYGVLFWILHSSLAREREERDKLMSSACRLCYEDGLLTEKNLELFRFGMSEPAWKEVVKTFEKQKAGREISEQTENERMSQ